VGRETFFEMWPMSFKEFLHALEKPSLIKSMSHFHLGDSINELTHDRFLEAYQQYLQVGGLPEVVEYFIQGKDYQKLRLDLLKSYEEDFVRYFSIDELNLFRRCLEAVAVNVGSPSKDTQVVRLDAPGYKKVSKLFFRLEKWKLIFKCEQWGLHPEKNKFFPKRYLYDVGILNYLRLKSLPSINIKDIASPLLRTPLGGLIENAVALGLRIQFGDNLFGLRLSSRVEIDFATKQADKIFAIEAKLSLKFKQNYLMPLKSYLEVTQGLSHGFLLYGGPPKREVISKIEILPFYLADELKRLISELAT
jgi:predicted AAA+ superfamily ATPase